MIGLAQTSELLGYTSIACWLGAQFPQVVENYQRRSCEGLSLPFIANWFLGDASNLVGCILTHQLPFQTYLAIYFVFVDLSLVGQYVYYQWWLKPSSPTHIKTRSTSAHRRRVSTSVLGSRPRYRTLSVAAANVAATAALAAQQEELRGHREQGTNLHHDSRLVGSSTNLLSREADDDEGLDDNLVNALADSFHSEGGRNIGRKRVFWSMERHGRRSSSSNQRYGTDTTTDHEEPQTTITPATRHNTVTSRQSAGLAFLSIFALFSVGNLVGHKDNVGSIIVPRNVRIRTDPSLESIPISPHSAQTIDFDELDSYAPSSKETVHTSHITVQIPSNISLTAHPEASGERIIGRIFSWLCTTLYLTSRLPQIWKNFARKSVEGLSVYLFIFAFLGNLFYVLSILSNPQAHQPLPASREFIKESIPYLLGSGGTFVFDVTIVMQVMIYRRKPRNVRRGRRRSIVAREEEETGLLAGDSVERHPGNESMVHSRDRTCSIHRLVLDYLTHSGYITSAQTFLSDSTVRHIDMDGDEVLDSKRELGEHSELSETTVKRAQLRNQIRYEILCGRIAEAVNIVNEHFPSLLSMEGSTNTTQSSSTVDYLPPTSVNPAHLLLNVRIQAFVEACRTVPLEYPHKSESDNSATTTSINGHPTVSTDGPETIDQQTALLKSAQKLHALANTLPTKKENERYMKELTNVVGLMAYRIPETSPVASYLSQERRDALAEQIDKAILCRLELPVISRLELLMRESCTTWDFLHNLKVPLKTGAHLFPAGYVQPAKGEDNPVGRSMADHTRLFTHDQYRPALP
ncbi:hypothetical protein L218DRAFT_860010 [Marasmius fiardii PR-910]|nr:hypothetical protein L218DRAFT_860010 [Marasmius fiardii PR-910]